MKRFTEEIRIIPAAAWLGAFAVYATLAVVLLSASHQMPLPFRAFFGLGLPLIALIYSLLAGYVYGDARRRNMRAVMWTLLVILIPNAIGFILYFILRDPLVTRCPACGGSVRVQFAFCPHCGASRGPNCPQCRQAVEAGWTHCSHCGAALKAQENPA
jgi:hypothetical protein